MTFVSYGSSPVGTNTLPPNNGVLEWDLPSTLTPGTYHLTYTMQINKFAPADVPLVNNAQMTYAGLPSPKTANAALTVLGNFSIAINIYNSAGEVVKKIPIKQFSTAITNITLSTTNTITTLQGSGSSIDIIFDGVVIGQWDGTNNQDQPVGNGTYKVQIDNISASGSVTSISQNAIVNRSIQSVEVDIFNEAGEIVRKLYNVISNPVGSSMTDVTLSSGVIKPSVVSGGPTASSLNINVLDTSAPVTLTWDGTNDAGSFVTPGEYQVQVHWTNGTGNTTNITRTVLVLAGTSVTGKVMAQPNSLDNNLNTTTTITAAGVTGAVSIKVRLYTISGEWLETLTSPSVTTTWTPSAEGRASGIYIAVVEVDGTTGGMIARQRLKVLYMH
jgi:flagellar hook assembly protein FlgD